MNISCTWQEGTLRAPGHLAVTVCFKEDGMSTGQMPLRQSEHDDSETCGTISSMLARVGDKWSLLVVSTLGDGPLRFNELRRRIGDISQKMLSSTVKALERDGMVSRKVTPTVPPQVEYELTDLGRELLVPVLGLAEWTKQNTGRILAARGAYDARVKVLNGSTGSGRAVVTATQAGAR
jgi:DNA-binding HxlR family transcriptional regulator